MESYDKGILVKDNAPKQMLKVLEEVGETSEKLLKNNRDEIVDGIGDSFVTLIILSVRNWDYIHRNAWRSMERNQR